MLGGIDIYLDFLLIQLLSKTRFDDGAKDKANSNIPGNCYIVAATKRCPSNFRYIVD